VTNPDTVRSNCYLIDTSGNKRGLTCSASQDSKGLWYVDVNCTANGFGEGGTAKGESFKFEIKGFTNPRIVNKKSQFKLFTMDSERRYID